MGAALVSIIFTGVAAGFALLIAPREGMNAGRIVAIWILSAALAFFIPDTGLAFIALAVLLTALAPLRAPARVAVYVACLFAIPIYFQFNIPFPGINYLIAMDYAKLATVVILGPVFLIKISSARPSYLVSVDRLLLAFVLLSGIMTIRDLPFTSMIRATVDQFLLIYVPYIAISRSLATQKDIESALRAFLFGAVILALVGFISSLQDWNYYAGLGANRYKIHSEYRGGFLRIYATLNPPLLGMIMGAGAVCALYFRSIKAKPAIIMLGVLAMFGFVAFVTGSRGGGLGAMLAVIAYLLLQRLSAAARRGLLILVGVAGLGMLFMLQSESTVIYDQYGSFNYRAELFRVSLDQIAQRPIFGSADFMEKAAFLELKQGEGIVDLVNAYLQIALYYGLVGLFMFAGAHLTALRRALSTLGELDKAIGKGMNFDAEKRVICVLAAIQLGYLAMISTTSGVSYVWHFGYLILGLLVAQLRSVKSRLAAPLPENAEAQPVAMMVEGDGPRPPIPKPYGARFVRPS